MAWVPSQICQSASNSRPQVQRSKSQSWLYLWLFPFFCIFSPFLFTSIIRGQSYSRLTKVSFGFISLLCCSLLFDYLVLVLCLINFFLLKNYYYFGAQGLRDLSSWTRDWTRVHVVKALSCNHQTIRELLFCFGLKTGEKDIFCHSFSNFLNWMLNLFIFNLSLSD